MAADICVNIASGEFTCLDAFQCHARDHPNHIALEHWDAERSLRISYEQLQAASTHAALGILHLWPTARGERLLSFCDESPALVISFLAIGFCGGIVVPLDPGAPEARLHAMIGDCTALAAVCSKTWLALLAAKLSSADLVDACGGPIAIESLEALLQVGERSSPLQPSVQASSAILEGVRPSPSCSLHLIYTSGSSKSQ